MTKCEQLRHESSVLAGGIGDLTQRACVYHHLYEHSGGNHVFPLLAAHGALWASGYFRAGMRMGSLLQWRYAGSAGTRQILMSASQMFADAFRDINRRVCVETYFMYHVTERPELLPFAEKIVPRLLFEQMLECHSARRQKRAMSEARKRELFAAFFLWEQENIVGPSVDKAFQDFEWQAIKAMALKPAVRFSYLPRHLPLRFRNFADTDERVEKGLRAFDVGAEVGWAHVESSLRSYRVMPPEFFKSSWDYFADIRQRLCPTGTHSLPQPAGI